MPPLLPLPPARPPLLLPLLAPELYDPARKLHRSEDFKLDFRLVLLAPSPPPRRLELDSKNPSFGSRVLRSVIILLMAANLSSSLYILLGQRRRVARGSLHNRESPRRHREVSLKLKIMPSIMPETT